MADQYHVSQYMYHALQQQQLPDAVPSTMLLQEQAQIVQANQSYYHQQKNRHRKKKHNRSRKARTKTSTMMWEPVVPSKIVTTTTRTETDPTVSVASIPSRSPPNRDTKESSPKMSTPAVTTMPSSTPSWTQIVQQAQSQQVADIASDDDDDHFYSARDQSQKSSSHHDRTTRFVTTRSPVHRDDDDDDDVHLDPEPIDDPSKDNDVPSDDDDSLPPASNIPPRRRSSLVVSKILQEQSDSIAGSVASSPSSSSNREDDDRDVTNDDSKPKAIPKRLPPKPVLDSNHVSVVVSSRPVVAEGEDVSAARSYPHPDLDIATTFRLGEIVQVQPRTGPGQNQPGGIAEITKVHLDRAFVAYDVRYVLNRRQRERHLEACYISVAPGYNDTSTVDTSTTIHTTHAAQQQQRYGPRRSCPNPVSVLPSPLRAALQADGCDVDGIATRKALSQYNNHQHRLKTNHNSDKENSHLQNKVLPREIGTMQKKKRKVMVTSTVTTTSSTTNSRQAPFTKRMKGADIDHSWDCSLEKAWTNTMKCQMADERYRNQIETALGKGVIFLCTSLLSSTEQEQLLRLCRLIHKQVKGMIVSILTIKSACPRSRTSHLLFIWISQN